MQVRPRALKKPDIRPQAQAQPSGAMEGTARRLFWLRVTVLGAFCVGLAMCAALWIGPRSYPLAPVSSLLPAIPGVVALGLYASLFVLAAMALLVPTPRWFIVAFVAVVAAFCLTDQTRWQPWVFQYSFLLMAIARAEGPRADVVSRNRGLNTARLVVACTYIFSGLQKMNSNFMDNDFPWLVQPITHLLPSASHLLHGFGMAVPFIQVGFGVGLLTQRFRRASLIAAVAMHVFILAMFGPAGLNWNDIVWPWTAAMAVFDVLLFSGMPGLSWRQIAWSDGNPIHMAAIVLFGVLPGLSFFNLWDS